jgi:hypothetical protein
MSCLAGLNVPPVSSAKFYKTHDEIEDLIQDACLDEMIAAGKKEREIAEQNGQYVHLNGNKILWCCKSRRHPAGFVAVTRKITLLSLAQ